MRIVYDCSGSIVTKIIATIEIADNPLLKILRENNVRQKYPMNESRVI
jgi:hypothetical protein